MTYIIIISIIISYISNKQIYIICKELNKNRIITISIYLITTISMILIYYKYGITIESTKYLSLIPFIIIISIIDYKTTYIYDITLLSGIIVQGAIFLVTINSKASSISNAVALLIGLIVPFILAKTTKGLGEGDIGLFGLCCFALGNNYSLYLISLSFVLASIYCMCVLLLKKGKVRKIPFAPFISLATIMIILTKYDLLKIYFYNVNRLF
ncbi:MAG: prepilin peptidase [Peptostreptococcaceae bacterium]